MRSTRAVGVTVRAGPSNVRSIGAAPAPRNTARYRGPGASGYFGRKTSAPFSMEYEPASAGTSPVPAYTANTDGQPAGGSRSAVIGTPRTLNVLPSSWSEIVCANALIGRVMRNRRASNSPPRRTQRTRRRNSIFLLSSVPPWWRVRTYGRAIVRMLIGPVGGANPPPPADVRITAFALSNGVR